MHRFGVTLASLKSIACPNLSQSNRPHSSPLFPNSRPSLSLGLFLSCLDSLTPIAYSPYALNDTANSLSPVPVDPPQGVSSKPGSGGSLTKAQYMAAWRARNPAKAKAHQRAQYKRIANDPQLLERRRQHQQRWYAKNSKTSIASHRAWRNNNPWAVTADRCRTLVRVTINSFMDGGKKFQALVGCSGKQLRDHLESLWLPGMSWTNFQRGGWTIGHKIPCVAFKDVLLTQAGQRAFFHYSNLQPEWEKANQIAFTKVH
jgi:hypothetical protein